MQHNTGPLSMQNFKIANQLLILFALLIVGTLGLLWWLSQTTQQVDERISSISEQTLVVTAQLSHIRNASTAIVGTFNARHAHIAPHFEPPAPPAQPEPPLAKAILKLNTHLSHYSRSVDTYFPEESSLRDHILGHAATLIDLAERLDVAHDATSSTANAEVLFSALIQAQINLQNAINEAMDNEHDEVAQRVEHLKEALHETNLTIWLGFLGLCALIAAAALYVARLIVRRLKALQAAAHKIGDIDLSVRVADDNRDELGDLSRSFNDMADQLSILIARRDLAEEHLRELNNHLESLVHSRTQEYKRATERAEDANRAKTKFLASMGHELRTPLNAIMGFAQMMKICDVSTEKQDEYISIIIDNCSTLLGEINQLLVLSELSGDTGKKLTCKPVSLAHAIETCISQSTHLAREYGVTIKNETKPKTLPSVWAQEIHLNIILNNLLANAIKYNRPLDAHVVLRNQSLSESIHRLIIEDTGLGFQESYPGQAVEPFERLKHFGGPIDGCGVGLTIASSFLNNINGTLGYEAIPEGGTRFWVDLEVARQSS